VVPADLSERHESTNGPGTAQEMRSGMARMHLALFLLHYEGTELE
jgi:hypothetical protein